jgi:hypothetical protein
MVAAHDVSLQTHIKTQLHQLRLRVIHRSVKGQYYWLQRLELACGVRLILICFSFSLFAGLLIIGLGRLGI